MWELLELAPANTEANAAIAMEMQTAGPASNFDMDPEGRQKTSLTYILYLTSPETHLLVHTSQHPG